MPEDKHQIDRTRPSRAPIRSFNFSLSAAHVTWSVHTDVFSDTPQTPNNSTCALTLLLERRRPLLFPQVFKHKSVPLPSALAVPACWCSADILYSLFSILVWSGATNRLVTNRVSWANKGTIKVFTVHLAGIGIKIYIFPAYTESLRRDVRIKSAVIVAGKHIFVPICRQIRVGNAPHPPFLYCILGYTAMG